MKKEGLLNFASSWLAAWTERDVGQLLAFYQDGCFYADPAVRKGLQGKQALAGHLYRLFDLYPGWKWEVVELWPTAEGFVLKWQASFGPLPDGIQETGLDIVVLRDGLIVRNEVWFDRYRLLANRQLGERRGKQEQSPAGN